MCSDKYDPEAQHLYKWSVPLREYMELHFRLMKELTELHFKLTKEKVEEAKVSMEKRLDGMNEFRDALKDQAGKFVTRAELLAMIIGISTVRSGVVTIVVRVLGK